MITLDFSWLLKNHFECSFVSLECSLQSSNVCFEVRSDNYDEPALQVLIGCHNKSANQIDLHCSIIVNTRNELQNKHTNILDLQTNIRNDFSKAS